MRSPVLRLAAVVLAIGSLVLPGCGTSSPGDVASADSTASHPSTRTIEDSLGTITVPWEAQRIATTAPAQTTAVLLLGGVDKLVAIEDSTGKNAWIQSKYPQLADLPVVFSNNTTNVEELLNAEPDLVAYASRYGEDTRKQLEELGIACIGGVAVEDEDFLNRVRDNQVHYGEAIGGAQMESATSYGTEFDNIRAGIEAKTKDLPKDKKPTVVQLSGNGEALQANNGSAIGQQLITMAGGVNAAEGATGESKGPSGQTAIESEQLLEWDPSILLVDSPEIRTMIQSDQAFSELQAVKSNKIFVIPRGAMAWAYNGPEEYLAMQFFAKAIQPELFADIDMETAARSFYSTYFGFELTDDDMRTLFTLADGATVEDVFKR